MASDFGILVFLFFILFIIYRIARFTALRLSKESKLKEFADINKEKQSMKFMIRLRKYFTWNVSINMEKGTAGGNIKIDFPIRSSLIIALICLILAMTIGLVSRYVIPGIFLLFTVYYLAKWFRSLNMLHKLVSIKNHTNGAVQKGKRIARSSHKKIILGICGGIAEYFGIKPFLVRVVFILLTFLYGAGIFLYLFCWIRMFRASSMRFE
ncbi:MAG: PspC domain-containing protein [Chitinophagales bacterium]